ncbi:MAG: ABC transporter ATP-binding protein [Ruminococcus sp.]|nr:ABC transporter ATP-binding protein [Ruminococcus sp.]MBR3667729.1 ABC transporter ATP-binding protein [Ruminococcus sp.]
MLCFKELTKKYGSFYALDNFQTELDSGIYALLGPNGAGKSTLMNILVGLTAPTSGEILFDGKNTEQMGEDFRAKIGYMPQYPGFYPGFTAMELMRYMADMKGYPRKERDKRCLELLESVNLTQQRDKKIKTFSGGMKQRLGLAQALINEPEILVLDEPTAGLDPKERVRFRNMVRKLSEKMTIIFCTHIVSDIETIAKEVILIHHGKLVQQGNIPALIKEMEGKVWEILPDADELELLLEQYPRSSLVSRNMQTVLRVVNDEKPHNDAHACEPVLEDVYLYQFGDDSV